MDEPCPIKHISLEEPCPIKHIPLEVLLRITYWLPTPDLGSMRLTCRAMETMLYNSFTTEFFSRKQFMLSLFSLQALINISKSRMGNHIRRLQFGTNSISNFPRSGRDYAQTAEAYAAHCELLTSGLHRDMLTEALRNLENLEDVVIRDFNSTRRSRDGPYAQWHSYGSVTAKEIGLSYVQMDHRISASKPLVHFPALLFNSLLGALGASGARPKGIEIMTRRGSNLSDFAFSLNPSLRPSVVSVLGRLEKLHLSVNFAVHFEQFNTSSDAKSPSASKGINLARFLTHTHNLKELRINETQGFNGGLTSFLTWLAQPVSPTAARDQGWPAPTALSKLEELSVGHMATEATVLLDVIKKFAPKLKSLEMWRVCLVYDYPVHLQDNTDSHFLSRLSAVPELDLRHIKIGFMEEAKDPRHINNQPLDRRRVLFKDAPDITYTGLDWKNFMRDTIPTLAAVEDRRQPNVYQESASNDSSSDDDEDMDDGMFLPLFPSSPLLLFKSKHGSFSNLHS